MSKRDLPTARLPLNRVGLGFDLSVSALERWQPGVRAAAADAAGTINIFGVIGEDWFSMEENTASRIGGELRAMAGRDVVININSPGGDFFEGLAIYNLLREHKGAVTVQVMGLAASAASIIAMAGDTILVPRAGFIMIHNVWVLAIGNRHDLREAADLLEPFDAVVADIYSARTGIDAGEISAMLDREAWIGGSEAVEKGFADELLPSDQITADPAGGGDGTPAAHKLDAAMAKAGVPRAERRRLIKELKGGMPGAALDTGKPGAAEQAAIDPAAITGLSEALAALRGTTLT